MLSHGVICGFKETAMCRLTCLYPHPRISYNYSLEIQIQFKIQIQTKNVFRFKYCFSFHVESTQFRLLNTDHLELRTTNYRSNGCLVLP